MKSECPRNAAVVPCCVLSNWVWRKKLNQLCRVAGDSVRMFKVFGRKDYWDPSTLYALFKMQCLAFIATLETPEPKLTWVWAAWGVFEALEFYTSFALTNSTLEVFQQDSTRFPISLEPSLSSLNVSKWLTACGKKKPWTSVDICGLVKNHVLLRGYNVAEVVFFLQRSLGLHQGLGWQMPEGNNGSAKASSATQWRWEVDFR